LCILASPLKPLQRHNQVTLIGYPTLSLTIHIIVLLLFLSVVKIHENLIEYFITTIYESRIPCNNIIKHSNKNCSRHDFW